MCTIQAYKAGFVGARVTKTLTFRTLYFFRLRDVLNVTMSCNRCTICKRVLNV